MLEGIILGGLCWWFSGFLSILWLSREHCPTWRELGEISLYGLLGPITWIIVGLSVLQNAEFWDKKICDTFKRKNTDATYKRKNTDLDCDPRM